MRARMPAATLGTRPAAAGHAAAWCRRASAGDNGHVTARPDRPRYRVRVEIPRLSGTRGWSAAATAFEQGLAAQASLLVTDRQIELVTRQRRG